MVGLVLNPTLSTAAFTIETVDVGHTWKSICMIDCVPSRMNGRAKFVLKVARGIFEDE